MALIETIQQTDLVSLSDADTQTALRVTVTLYEDHELHQWTYVFQQLLIQGLSASIVVSAPRLLDAIGDAGVALDKSIAAGIDFADELTIAQIQAANVTAPPEAVQVLSGMLAIGRPQGPRWKIPTNGIATEPTVQEIANARAKIAATSWWLSIQNGSSGVNAYLATDTATIAGVKSIVAAG